MPDRDFDKSIQRKANELRLEPSPEIWERVAEQIQDKDRKRGFAWFWLAAAMIAGGLALWFFGPSVLNDTDSVNQQVAIQPSSKTPPSVSSNQAEPATEQHSSTIPANELTSTLPPLDHSKTTHNENGVKSKTDKSNAPVLAEGIGLTAKSGKGNKAQSSTNAIEKNTIASAPSKEMSGASMLHQENTTSDVLSVIETAGDETALYGRTINGGLNRPEYLPVQEPKVDEGDTKLASSLLVASPVKTKAPKEGWDLTLQFGGGSGSMREGISHSYAPPRYEYMASGNIGFSPPALAAPVDPRPSEVKAGPSFQASIGVSKPIGRKTSFITGLQYAYFSNRIEVGQKIDSSAISSNFRLQTADAALAYTGVGNNGTTYYNAYHYLQIPLEIGWALDNRNRLSWNNGLVIGYLLSTDALHYNAVAGAYYKDNGLVNKWQTSAQTSFQYRLFPGNKWNLSVGPYLNYQLRNIDKTADSKRLLTVGFTARLLFNKSK